MPDDLTPEQRRRTMQAVKSTDTGPERKLTAALLALGVTGWERHCATLPGKPDFAFAAAQVAVFVDGGFWHGHPDRYWQGRSGAYWDKKIARNQARDRRVDAELQALGWRVFRLWDFEVQRDPAAAAERVRGLVAERAGEAGALPRVAEAAEAYQVGRADEPAGDQA